MTMLSKETRWFMNTIQITRRIHSNFIKTLCLLALTPTLAFAGTQSKTVNEAGIIKSVDMNNRTLVVTESKNTPDKRLQWTNTTRFTLHNKRVSPSALKDGERVHFTYKAGVSPLTMESVHISPAKSEKHAHKKTPGRKTSGS